MVSSESLCASSSSINELALFIISSTPHDGASAFVPRSELSGVTKVTWQLHCNSTCSTIVPSAVISEYDPVCVLVTTCVEVFFPCLCNSTMFTVSIIHQRLKLSCEKSVRD